jgi:hypothetical protein|nr:O-antigen ligase family protein [Vallitaleaceae bacterium]
LFILSIKVLREEIDYKILVIVMAISSGIIGLIGLTQFVGMDLFKTDLGRFLISLTSRNVDITATRYTVADSVIYSTLYNPNYVGSYICLILPVIISVWLVVRKKWLKWLGGALIVLLALNIAGSKSLPGFIGLFASMVVWLVFNRHNIKKNYKKWLPIIGVISIGLGLFIGLSTADIAVKVRTNVGELAQVVVGSEVVSNTELIEHVYELDGGVFIETTYRGLYVGRIDAATYVFADMDANALELIPDDSGYYVFADARYNDLQVEFFNAGSIIKVNMADIPVVFQFVGSKVYALGQNYNLYDTDYEVPSFGFADHQTFGTKRGYIWSKTLPLLKDHLVVGTGPDTFAIVFPQYDYIGKTNMYHEPGQIVDKPHNMYLQIALQTGVLSLVIFLSFMMVYFIYFLKTYKVYRDVHPSKFLYHLNIGIALSLLGYLVAGIGNDTTIATSSVFWILLGTGISLQITNHLTQDITE